MNNHPNEWHLDPTALQEYAAGTASDAVAWSVETHLQACPDCRELVAHALTSADADALATARAAIDLPVQTPVRRHLTAQRHRTPRRRPNSGPHATLSLGILGPWWAWAGLVVAAIASIGLTGGIPIGDLQQRHGLTWALALSPLIPVALVAAVYRIAERDETVDATPRGGLELILIRTLAVLTMALPSVAIGLWLAETSTASWLLPSLGLCAGALTLGSWVGVERAALAITCGWALIVSLAMLPDSAFAEAIAPVIHPTAQSAPAWGAVLLTALVVLLWRRHSFDTPGSN